MDKKRTDKPRADKKKANEKNADGNKKKLEGKKLSRWQVLLIFLVFVLLGVLALWFGCRWKRNRGILVFPESDREIPLREDVFYSQKDERWAEGKLGDSRFTMRSSGCLVCCIAASLELQGREEEDPGSLNQALSDGAGYDEEGNLQWDALSQMDGRIQVDRCNTVNAASLQESLEAGRFPIVRVRLGGVGSVHYVLIIGAKDGVYWCMDPLKESAKAVPLSDFGHRVYAVRYVDFKEENTK